MRKQNILLGSLNILKPPEIITKMANYELFPDSPPAINHNLELNRLENELFPILVTGIRVWPFLTLAFNNDTKSKNNLIKMTNKLRGILKKKVGNRPIGPKSSQSLKLFNSMCRKMESDSKCANLCVFLKKTKFNGTPSFFRAYLHEEKWKKLFLEANGKQGKAYIRAHKESENSKSVLDVVTRILSEHPDTYNKTLWYGAFCYAFLRCIYGNFDRHSEETTSYGEYSLKWKNHLLKIFSKHKSFIPKKTASSSKYPLLLERIKNETSIPPLAAIAKKWRKENRPVLSGLKIDLFHNLLYKPTPSIIETYCNK